MSHTKTLLRFYDQGIHIVSVNSRQQIQGTYDYIPRRDSDPRPWIATDPDAQIRPNPRHLMAAHEGTGAFLAFFQRCPMYRCRGLVDAAQGIRDGADRLWCWCPHCGTGISRLFGVHPGRSVWTPWLTGQQAMRVYVWAEDRRAA